MYSRIVYSELYMHILYEHTCAHHTPYYHIHSRYIQVFHTWVDEADTTNIQGCSNEVRIDGLVACEWHVWQPYSVDKLQSLSLHPASQNHHPGHHHSMPDLYIHMNIYIVGVFTIQLCSVHTTGYLWERHSHDTRLTYFLPAVVV